MRVVLNGLAALKPKTGVGHHVADLYAALCSHFQEDQFNLYPGRMISRTVARLRAQPKSPALSPNQRSSAVKRGLRSAVVAAAKAASGLHFVGYTRAFGFDLYHEPNFVPFRTHLPTVVTVHDLSVLKYPQWHPADRVRQHQRHFQRGLGRSRHVIVVSHAVRRELIDELGCPPDRVSVVYNGVGRQYVLQPTEVVSNVRRKYGLPDRFFLCVGTIEPRKNLGTVIRAFADLPPQVRFDCPLVLVGPWGWRAEVERRLFDEFGQPAGVRHVGYVSANDLPALYSAARVLLYPSHYEGFGFPPVEMLACGGGVIASTADAVKEVLGGHGWYVEPEDVAGWRNVMGRVATDDDLLNRLRVKGIEHAAQYSWERAAVETVAVYRKVLGQAVEHITSARRPDVLAA